MDNIKVGLDFGTHQTKICVQRTPDEGHGQPIYEFFKFKDLNGQEQYFLPSVVQQNTDNTFSYGYVNEKNSMIAKEPFFDEKLFTYKRLTETYIENEAKELFDTYAIDTTQPEDIKILKEAIRRREKKIEEQLKEKKADALAQYEAEMQAFKKSKAVFRYFKQATFSEREWEHNIDFKALSVLYLAYVIFLLEDEYGTDFSINMGVPTDDKEYPQKKQLAVEILASAYTLVEGIYENDKIKFLNEKIPVLLSKIQYVNYSDEIKDDYVINIFPEAYAGLITLTSRGKIADGMSLTADIGGGTTDISFFTLHGNTPAIYHYWSIPRGLNYIAEESGFDYADKDLSKYANQKVIDLFNRKKKEIVNILINKLVKLLVRETEIPAKNLYDALKDRVLVYNGGGSTYSILTDSILYFTDVKLIDQDMWKEENVIDKEEVSKLCQLLTTAYGLSLAQDDSEVELCDFQTIFSTLPKSSSKEYNIIDKDMC